MSDQAPGGASPDWYASPTTARVDPEGPGEESPIYFPVPIEKLVILCLCTLGLYQTYWFFKNFQLEAERAGRGRVFGPLVRAVFSVLLAYGLFTDIKRQSELLHGPRLHAGLLALVWAVLSISYRLPDPYWLISSFNFVALLPVQSVVNEINARRSPSADRNEGFGPWELGACGIGLVLTALALVGTFAPEVLLDPLSADD